MLRSQTPQNAGPATGNRALGAAGQRAGVGSVGRPYFLSFFLFFFNFLELFVLGGGQLLSVIAESGVQRQA